MSDRLPAPLPWLGGLLALYLLAPLVAFLVRLGNGAPSAPGLGSAILTSLLTATISSALIALLGIPLAYVLARSRGRLARALTLLVALPVALPPLVGGILLLYLVGPYTFLGEAFGGRLTDSATGIVIAQVFVAAPFLVIAARAAFAGVDPQLEEMARTLGHTRTACFRRVSLPVAWPGVQAGLLLAWLRAFGEFGATVILAYHPYSLPVYTFVQFDSAGIPGTLLPVSGALGTALIVLLVSQAHVAKPRRRGRVPAPAGPPQAGGTELDFDVRARLGGFTLEVAGAGRRIALLGASGAGKTLTLRVLAGLAPRAHARILTGSRELGATPVERRGIGYLPQDAALLPRRTVWQQVTFGPHADPARAAWWLAHLGLEGLEWRYPDELSGGQRRRVALCRALAHDPAVVLLDEPFGALDAGVRARLARDLRRLQRQTGLCTVLVTHDPEEAALLSDEVVVLDGGSVLQRGPAPAVFERPACAAVARLVGIANVHEGTVAAAGVLRSGALELRCSTSTPPVATPVAWAVRAEDVRLDARGEYEAMVLDTARLPLATEVTLDLAGVPLSVRLPRGHQLAGHETAAEELAPGVRCRVRIPPDAVSVWRAA